MMKTKNIAAVLLSLVVLTGCETTPETRTNSVRLGMTRDDLRSRFGEPLRSEADTAGGEIWYYRFVSWSNQPTGSSETRNDFGGSSSTVTVGWQFTQVKEDRPIRISADGFVTDPIPEGRIAKK